MHSLAQAKHLIFFFFCCILSHNSEAASVTPLDELKATLNTLKIIQTSDTSSEELSKSMAAMSIEPAAESLKKQKEALLNLPTMVNRSVKTMNFTQAKLFAEELFTFGESLDGSLWKLAYDTYMEEAPASLKPWHAWVQSQEGVLKPTREDILSCIMCPILHTAQHTSDVWENNPIVMLWFSYASNLGNPYAEAHLKKFMKRRSADDRDLFEDNAHRESIAKFSNNTPVNEDSFDPKKSSMNKLLFHQFGSTKKKYGVEYVKQSAVREARESEIRLLETIEQPTAETLYCIGMLYLQLDSPEAEDYLRRASDSQSIDAQKALHERWPERYTFDPPAMKSLEDEDAVVYHIYKEVLKILS